VFTGTAWTATDVTVSGNVTVGPDGGVNASKILVNASPTAASLSQSVTGMTNSNFIYSVKYKAGTVPALKLTVDNGSGNGAIIGLIARIILPLDMRRSVRAHIGKKRLKLYRERLHMVGILLCFQ